MSARCISPPWPPSLSSNCKSDGMLPQSDYYWDLILFSGITFTFFQKKILPAKSFWSHGRFLMAGSFENVTWNGIYKYFYHIIILKGSTCGLITEQIRKSVPKNGRKLVVFWGNLSEPNLKLTFGLRSN